MTIILETKDIPETTKIWHFTHIREGCTVGENCTIGSHCYIDRGVTIGNNCKIQSGCQIYRPAKIGNGVFIGPKVVITNDKYPKAIDKKGEKMSDSDWKCETVVVKDGASIGAGSILIAGVTIGKNALVGAGSVVTKDVPDNSVCYGVPSKCHK
jgi:UDP-2-acetamido-3-amino-2,3-dideoxy-glucuronate N-acetyltransferase